MAANRHSLSNIDVESRRAECAICGPVKVYKNGARYWVCSTKAKECNAAWREKHPGKMAELRQSKSPHHLIDRDLKSMTGECPICGPVYIVPFGRGYACGNRANELRGKQQEAPQAQCWKCLTWDSVENPIFMGICDRCERVLQPGGTTYDWLAGRPMTVERLREARFLLECEESGMHVGYPDDPYDLDDQQAVKGWKTIGSPLPTR